MVVVGKLLKFLVLHDLEIPEAEGENRKGDSKAHLQHHEPDSDASAIVDRARNQFGHLYPLLCVLS